MIYLGEEDTVKHIGSVCSVLALAALVLLSGSAGAAPILPGLYQLHNHPDGAINPPPYGLRLDELYDISPGDDRYTCDFDDPASDMKLIYNDVADTITIFGHSLCGRDTGAGYAADIYLDIYTINFVYNVGVEPVPGDDDIQVDAADFTNVGTITHPGLGTSNLSDVRAGGNTFRFGDEDNDLGHRGFAGISGWGWLAIDGDRRAGDADDWLFTATYIPEPASLGLLLVGLVSIIRRK